MNDKQFTENKIIILYILSEISLPVTTLQLTDILMQNAFMNYFSQQENISELLDAGMLKEYTDETQRKFFIITPEGKDAGRTLLEMIPQIIKHNLDKHKEEIRKSIKRDWEINASQYIDENDDHYVRCYVRDGNAFLIDMKISAGNEKMASKMCVNWKKNTEKIYSLIISHMLE